MPTILGAHRCRVGFAPDLRTRPISAASSIICPPTLHFIAYVDKQIVSHAVVTTRWVQPEWRPLLRTAYVDTVATLPAYQRRGHGRAVMRELAANIYTYDIACLKSDRADFFERLGWERWRGPRAGRSGNELIPKPDQQNIMILRLVRTPPLDLDRLLTIETQTGRIW